MGEIQISMVPAANLLQALGKGTPWRVHAVNTGTNRLAARLVRAREQKSEESGVPTQPTSLNSLQLPLRLFFDQDMVAKFTLKSPFKRI